MKVEDLDRYSTYHYTEMPEPPADSPIYREVRTFLREMPRLLAEGHEGKWALIRGDEVIAIFETMDEGYRAGRERFGIGTQPPDNVGLGVALEELDQMTADKPSRPGDEDRGSTALTTVLSRSKGVRHQRLPYCCSM